MKKKILIVDDEESILEGFQEIFEKEGYEISVATTGTEACELAEQEKPDLVILDYYLISDISGVEVCTHIKNQKKLKNTKLIMITGVLAKKQAHDMMHFGFDKVLIKPVENQHLIEEVRLLLSS